MPELVQIKAQIPRELKKRVFVALAEREQKFTPWLRQQLENLLQQPNQAGGRNVRREGE